MRFIGHQNDQLKHPYYLCIDGMDNIHVGSGLHSGFPMQIFDKDGNLINSLKLKENGTPTGVNINSINGSLMVTDYNNHVVYIY